MPQASALSAGHLLQFIREGRVRTRRDLMDVTGLARSTVAQRVDQLVRAGYVREGGMEASTGGRRPNLLRLDEESAVVLAADLGATHGRVAVMDLAGRTLAERAERLIIKDGPRKVLPWVIAALRDLLAEAGRSVSEVGGVGVGLPCPIDVAEGRVIETPVAPGWHEADVTGALAAIFPGPVLLGNDANVMALGEHTRLPGVSTLVLVKVGTAVGAAILEGGRVLHGVGGAAGEIGHVRVPGFDDVPCACGAAGCLAAVASGGAVARELSTLEPGVRDTADVVRLVRAGHPDAVRLTRRAGRILGEVLSTVISVVNPGVLIVSGALSQTGDHLIGGVREVVYQRTPYRSTRGLRIAEGELGGRAGVVGAAAMVVERILSPEAVDAQISAGEELGAAG